MKELLVKQGISEEQATSILNAMKEANIHTTSLENVDVRYNKLQEQKKQLEEASKNYEKQLKELSKNNVDNEELKKQLEQLQLSNKELEEKHSNEMNELQFNHALDNALSTAKCKNNKALKALLDIDNIKYQEGKLNGLDSQIETLQKEASYLFDLETTPGSTGGIGNFGRGNGVKATTKEEFKQMTMTQRLKLKNDNPNLYSELTEG